MGTGGMAEGVWINTLMVVVISCSDELLGPRFGYAVPGEQVAYIREDLPQCVKEFVIAHELYHLQDTARWWVWREIKANGRGALKHPFGFVVCVLMSLTLTRLGYYWQRIKGRQD